MFPPFPCCSQLPLVFLFHSVPRSPVLYLPVSFTIPINYLFCGASVLFLLWRLRLQGFLSPSFNTPVLFPLFFPPPTHYRLTPSLVTSRHTYFFTPFHFFLASFSPALRPSQRSFLYFRFDRPSSLLSSSFPPLFNSCKQGTVVYSFPPNLSSSSLFFFFVISFSLLVLVVSVDFFPPGRCVPLFFEPPLFFLLFTRETYFGRSFFVEWVNARFSSPLFL